MLGCPVINALPMNAVFFSHHCFHMTPKAFYIFDMGAIICFKSNRIVQNIVPIIKNSLRQLDTRHGHQYIVYFLFNITVYCFHQWSNSSIYHTNKKKVALVCSIYPSYNPYSISCIVKACRIAYDFLAIQTFLSTSTIIPAPPSKAGFSSKYSLQYTKGKNLYFAIVAFKKKKVVTV